MRQLVGLTVVTGIVIGVLLQSLGYYLDENLGVGLGYFPLGAVAGLALALALTAYLRLYELLQALDERGINTRPTPPAPPVQPGPRRGGTQPPAA